MGRNNRRRWGRIIDVRHPNLDEHVDARVVSPKGTLPIDAAGTGFLQTVQILAYTAKYRPQLLLLDEPDSHIHPDRQRQLVLLLSELAVQQDFQVLIATHSRHLLDDAVEGRHFHWMSDGVRLEESKLDRVRVLTDLGALDRGDLLKAGQVDAVVLTEDSHTEALEALLQSSGFEPTRTQIWSYFGCTKIDAAEILAQFIRDHAPGTQVIVHRDRDYLSGDEVEELRRRFSDKGFHLFVTDGTDLESHFVEVAHIRHCYPQLSPYDIDPLIDAATLAVQDASVRMLAQKQFDGERNERRAKSKTGDPDFVSITDNARSLFAADPRRWRHGKKFIGHLISKLQTLLNETPRLFRPSPALSHPTLREAHEAVSARYTGLVPSSSLASTPADPSSAEMKSQEPLA